MKRFARIETYVDHGRALPIVFEYLGDDYLVTDDLRVWSIPSGRWLSVDSRGRVYLPSRDRKNGKASPKVCVLWRDAEEAYG